ncbi:MAG: DEAD/DEAH box helicase [Succinivibrio sp.]|nr:DEAD/DEAH box helicase [Succinivibrio sp.]
MSSSAIFFRPLQTEAAQFFYRHASAGLFDKLSAEHKKLFAEKSDGDKLRPYLELYSWEEHGFSFNLGIPIKGRTRSHYFYYESEHVNPYDYETKTYEVKLKALSKELTDPIADFLFDNASIFWSGPYDFLDPEYNQKLYVASKKVLALPAEDLIEDISEHSRLKEVSTAKRNLIWAMTVRFIAELIDRYPRNVLDFVLDRDKDELLLERGLKLEYEQTYRKPQLPSMPDSFKGPEIEPVKVAKLPRAARRALMSAKAAKAARRGAQPQETAPNPLDEQSQMRLNQAVDNLRLLSALQIPTLTDLLIKMQDDYAAQFLERGLTTACRKIIKATAKRCAAVLRGSTERTLPTYSSEVPFMSFDKNGLCWCDEGIYWQIHTTPKKITCSPVLDGHSRTKKQPFQHEMFQLQQMPELVRGSDRHLEAMFHVWRLATELCSRGAMVPACLTVENEYQGSYFYSSAEEEMVIRWVPAACSPVVARLCAEVGRNLRALPRSFLNFDTKKAPSDLQLGLYALGFFMEGYIAEEGKQDLLRLKTLPWQRSGLFAYMRSPGSLRAFAYATDENVDHTGRWLNDMLYRESEGTPALRFSVVTKEQNKEENAEHWLDLDGFELPAGEELIELDLRVAGYPPLYGGKTLSEADFDAEDEAEADKPTAAEQNTEQNAATAAQAESKAQQKQLPAVKPQWELSVRDLYQSEANSSHAAAVVKPVRRLGRIRPEMAEFYYHPLRRHAILAEDFEQFIKDSAVWLKSYGVELQFGDQNGVLPIPRSMLNVKLNGKWESSTGFVGLSELLDYDWKLAIGDKNISEEDFKKLCKRMGQLVQFNDSYIYVDPETFGKILDKLSKKQQAISKPRLIAAAMTGEFEGQNAQVSEQIIQALQGLMKQPEVALPGQLEAKLRPYQERGFSWLYRNLKMNMGSIIADDMGLGKTVQVIAALSKLKEEGELTGQQALVVVPTSVLINWERELSRFAPKLTVSRFYGPGCEFRHDTDVVLTSYGKLRRSINELTADTQLKLRVLVIDEAQNIKNHLSQAAKAVRSLKPSSAIAMTGTPVENRLMDYWSIMEFVNPGLMGSSAGFKREFATPIEKHQDEEAATMFRSVTSPFILRRVKTDRSIISDLPDKLTTDTFCELTQTQAAMYQNAIDDQIEAITTSEDKFTRSRTVLDLIRKLKQICDSPALLIKDGRYDDPKYSGKADMLLGLIGALQDAGNKALIFTQYVEMGHLIQKWIEQATGFKPSFLHGSTPMKQRTQMIDRFSVSPEEFCFILSLKAGGTGVNLTAATAVIHYDLWWNPAVEEQATDRSFRIGQTKNVQVNRFICANTFEEKINLMLQRKKELAELTVSTGEKWLGDLSDNELMQILTIGNK